MLLPDGYNVRLKSARSPFLGRGDVAGKKISQDELAKTIGVNAPVIGRYERNEVKSYIEVATKMAEALGVSLDYLVGFADYELDSSIT